MTTRPQSERLDVESIAALLAAFPKLRPPLPDDIANIYTRQYKQNRDGGTPASALSRWTERWLHRRVARDVIESRNPRSTLEIGAGTLNQLEHEPIVGPYDIVEPFRALFEGSPGLDRVRDIYVDIAAIPEDRRYDRITSIATFEHICDLPEVIARSGMLLKSTGVLRVSIPSEGTWPWALGWKLTTGLEFRIRNGSSYGLLMRHEHVNTAIEIEALLRYFYGAVGMSVFGFHRRLSLYQYFECRNPQLERCRAVLGGSVRVGPGRAGKREGEG